MNDTAPRPRRAGWHPWLMAVAGLALLTVVPLPRSCDPRAEEVPGERHHELGRHAGALTRGELEAALRIVDPHQALAPYLTITDEALTARLQGPAGPAIRIALRSAAAAPVAWPATGAIKVALDPGHSGGQWSLREQRHLQRGGGPPLREGNLSWGTARLAERDLRQRGIAVQLVRGPPPSAPFEAGLIAGYDPALERRFWLAENHLDSPRPWLSAWSALALWRLGREYQVEHGHDLFTRFELRRRAEAAQAFSADLTLSLHYNYTHSGRNGVLVFVPGNFLPGELVTASQRFWALRRALDGTLPRTIALASALGGQLMQRLDLPALPDEGDGDPAPWLAVDPAHGVFARNLAILRRTPGPALVLEGPCLSDPTEYQRMKGTQIEVDGQRYPDRVRQYADAVVAGVAMAAEGSLETRR